MLLSEAAPARLAHHATPLPAQRGRPARHLQVPHPVVAAVVNPPARRPATRTARTAHRGPHPHHPAKPQVRGPFSRRRGRRTEDRTRTTSSSGASTITPTTSTCGSHSRTDITSRFIEALRVRRLQTPIPAGPRPLPADPQPDLIPTRNEEPASSILLPRDWRRRKRSSRQAALILPRSPLWEGFTSRLCCSEHRGRPSRGFWIPAPDAFCVGYREGPAQQHRSAAGRGRVRPTRCARQLKLIAIARLLDCRHLVEQAGVDVVDEAADCGVVLNER